MVRVEDGGRWFVHNLPASVEDAFRDAQVFEHSQMFRKAHRLPYAASNRGVGIGKMVKPVSQSIAALRILDKFDLAIDRIQSALALERGARLGDLTAIHCAYARIVKV